MTICRERVEKKGTQKYNTHDVQRHLLGGCGCAQLQVDPGARLRKGLAARHV